MQIYKLQKAIELLLYGDFILSIQPLEKFNPLSLANIASWGHNFLASDALILRVTIIVLSKAEYEHGDDVNPLASII